MPRLHSLTKFRAYSYNYLPWFHRYHLAWLNAVHYSPGLSPPANTSYMKIKEEPTSLAFTGISASSQLSNSNITKILATMSLLRQVWVFSYSQISINYIFSISNMMQGRLRLLIYSYCLLERQKYPLNMIQLTTAKTWGHQAPSITGFLQITKPFGQFHTPDEASLTCWWPRDFFSRTKASLGRARAEMPLCASCIATAPSLLSPIIDIAPSIYSIVAGPWINTYSNAGIAHSRRIYVVVKESAGRAIEQCRATTCYHFEAVAADFAYAAFHNMLASFPASFTSFSRPYVPGWFRAERSSIGYRITRISARCLMIYWWSGMNYWLPLYFREQQRAACGYDVISPDDSRYHAYATSPLLSVASYVPISFWYYVSYHFPGFQQARASRF